jgi:hypothetical protein
LRPGNVYKLNADDYIRSSELTGPEVAYAIWQMALAKV